jgi:hypothetical protein
MPDFSWIRHIPLAAWIAIGVVGFLIAILTLVGAVRMVVKLIRLRRHLGELPASGKVAFWGSLLYTIFPLDLLPDPIYLDDMAVLGAALLYLTHLWRKQHGNVPIPGRKSKTTPGSAVKDLRQ